MRTPPPPEMTKLLIYDLVKGIDGMKFDIAHYDRITSNHPEKTYEFLRHCCLSNISRSRQDSNRAALDKQFNPGATITTAPAVGDKKEACRNFIAGTCTKGDKCKYSHKEDKPGKGKTQQAKTKTEDTTTVAPTPKAKAKAEPKAKAAVKTIVRVDEPCRSHAAGSCSYGDTCRFLHDGVPTTGTPKAPKGEGKGKGNASGRSASPYAPPRSTGIECPFFKTR